MTYWDLPPQIKMDDSISRQWIGSKARFALFGDVFFFVPAAYSFKQCGCMCVHAYEENESSSLVSHLYIGYLIGKAIGSSCDGGNLPAENDHVFIL